MGVGLEAQKALLSDYGSCVLVSNGGKMQPTKDEAPEWWNTLGLLGNNPTRPGITMNMILPEQTDLFQDTRRWPRHPYCTDDFESGVRIRSLKQAMTKCYIQANPPHLRVWSLYDIDRPGGGLAWEDANLPSKLGHGQQGERPCPSGLWLDRSSADFQHGSAASPLRYLNAVEAAFRAKLGGRWIQWPDHQKPRTPPLVDAERPTNRL